MNTLVPLIALHGCKTTIIHKNNLEEPDSKGNPSPLGWYRMCVLYFFFNQTSILLKCRTKKKPENVKNLPINKQPLINLYGEFRNTDCKLHMQIIHLLSALKNRKLFSSKHCLIPLLTPFRTCMTAFQEGLTLFWGQHSRTHFW